MDLEFRIQFHYFSVSTQGSFSLKLVYYGVNFMLSKINLKVSIL